MEKKKTVTIILLNYNGKADTLDCLKSLGKLTQKHARIRTTVVDNASGDGSVSAIRKAFPNVKVIANEMNLGFCEGNNLGASDAFRNGSDYVLILNNDTVVDGMLVDQLVEVVEKEGVEIASPKIYFASGFEFHHDRYKEKDRGKVIWYAGGEIDWANVLPHHRGVDEVDHGQYDEVFQIQFATGCATLVSRKAYEAIGLYDPIYFAYFEDADFSIRARKQGLRVLYIPDAMLWHKNASTFGGSGSPFQDYFITRNRLIFGLRHAPARVKLALLRESARFLMKGPVRRRRAVLDALSRRLPNLESLR